MTARYRLNLEAPFLHATSYDYRLSPAKAFEQAAAKEGSEGATTDTRLRRPSPQSRAQGVDYAGETMARYVSGLETRLAVHIKKHAPNWLEKEKHKILNRWSAPQPKPAPSWAPPPDREKDARDYANALLKERLRSRMQRLADIRIARTLDDEAGPSLRRRLRMNS
ncbi:hypothetical protein [Pelagibacterium montanilacus]|uniref:hypothetical protein n=1 Tax=Pelagibacterium montanilacus TaxID=2185280 RepID=UPI000F8F7D4D|nr:hypothetical protein [Pelagibacterium montanilacus]